jgi:hypothetical protein
MSYVIAVSPLGLVAENIASLVAQFFALQDEHLREYSRMRRADGGRASGRVFAMLYYCRDRKDPIDFARRMLRAKPDGLLHLAKHGKLDISLEADLLRPEFDSLFPEDIKLQARANLAWAKVQGMTRTKHTNKVARPKRVAKSSNKPAKLERIGPPNPLPGETAEEMVQRLRRVVPKEEA